MDIGHLVGGLGVEVDKLLSRWSGSSLVVVRRKGVEDALNTSGDAVRLIGGLGLLGSLVLGVKVVEGLKELVGNTVFLVEIQSALSSLVTDGVAVGEILGDDAGAWLLLLGDLVGVLLSVGWLVLLCSFRAGDGNLGAAELGVVKEEGRLGGRLLLEGYRGILGLAGWGDLDLGNLSAEAEEPEGMELVAKAAADEVQVSLLLDLLLRGGGRDVLNVNSVAHVCGCVCEYV